MTISVVRVIRALEDLRRSDPNRYVRLRSAADFAANQRARFAVRVRLQRAFNLARRRKRNS